MKIVYENFLVNFDKSDISYKPLSEFFSLSSGFKGLGENFNITGNYINIYLEEM
jgi:hypothetical protein